MTYYYAHALYTRKHKYTCCFNMHAHTRLYTHMHAYTRTHAHAHTQTTCQQEEGPESYIRILISLALKSSATQAQKRIKPERFIISSRGLAKSQKQFLKDQFLGFYEKKQSPSHDFNVVGVYSKCWVQPQHACPGLVQFWEYKAAVR